MDDDRKEEEMTDEEIADYLLEIFEQYRLQNQRKERTQEQIDNLQFLADMVKKVAPQKKGQLAREFNSFIGFPEEIMARKNLSKSDIEVPASVKVVTVKVRH